MAEFSRPQRASGVIETLLISDGAPLELDAHLARMDSSLRELFAGGLPEGARELVLQHAATLQLGRLRLTVAPGAPGELHAEAHTAQVAEADVFPAWERGVALRGFAFPGGLGPHKWADRSALAQLEARCAETELPLLLDEGERALEASRANLFAVRAGELITPPADGRILAGIARERALEAARALSIEAHEQPLTVEALRAAGEAFLTGSIRGVEPVRALDGMPLRAPGAETSAISARLRRSWLGRDAGAGEGTAAAA